MQRNQLDDNVNHTIAAERPTTRVGIQKILLDKRCYLAPESKNGLCLNQASHGFTRRVEQAKVQYEDQNNLYEALLGHTDERYAFIRRVGVETSQDQ